MGKKFDRKIFVLVTCKNELKNIETCLKSLKWIENIVVVDTGSTDGTVEIAKKYRDNVYSYPFKGSYADVRNFGLSKVKSEWVLVLDADEILSPDVEEKISELISSEKYDGYWFPRRNYINEKKYLKHGYFYPDFQLRLFRNNPDVRYTGKVHEHLNIPKEKTKEIRNIEIFHNSSHTKYDSFFHFHRFYPYIRIEGKEIAKSDSSNFYLLKESVTLSVRHAWRSIVAYQGYKDGYIGLRAGILWGMYESARYLYALYTRIKKNENSTYP